MKMFFRLIHTTLFCLFLFNSVDVFAQTKKVVLYGDSISAGYGMTLEESWPNLINLTYENENTPVRLINESISGETTGGGLARIDEVLSRHKLSPSDWIIIELGGNDGLRGFPIKTIQNNLEQLVVSAKQFGINVALMQVRIPPNYGKRYTNMFTDLYPKVAKKHDVTLVPFFMDQIAINPNYMQRDGIHPNKSAQIIIRDIMKKEINQLVE